MMTSATEFRGIIWGGHFLNILTSHASQAVTRAYICIGGFIETTTDLGGYLLYEWKDTRWKIVLLFQLL